MLFQDFAPASLVAIGGALRAEETSIENARWKRKMLLGN
jgi:hypothetical protein